MLSTSHATLCPACGSADLSVLGRVESDPFLASDGDLEVYACRDCGGEFDNQRAAASPPAAQLGEAV